MATRWDSLQAIKMAVFIMSIGTVNHFGRLKKCIHGMKEVTLLNLAIIMDTRICSPETIVTAVVYAIRTLVSIALILLMELNVIMSWNFQPVGTRDID